MPHGRCFSPKDEGYFSADLFGHDHFVEIGMEDSLSDNIVLYVSDQDGVKPILSYLDLDEPISSSFFHGTGQR